MNRPVIAVLALAALCSCAREAPPPDDTTPPAPPLRAVEHGGRVFDLARQRDTAVVVFFGYTQCPDFCPTTLADFAAVHRRLGAAAGRVKFVFVSVDSRDTPEAAQAYARRFDPALIGLAPDSAALRNITQDFHVQHFPVHDSTTNHMEIGHSADVIVVSPSGRIIGRVLQGQGRQEWLFNTLMAALQG